MIKMAGKTVDRDGVKTLWMRFLASMAKHTGDMDDPHVEIIGHLGEGFLSTGQLDGYFRRCDANGYGGIKRYALRVEAGRYAYGELLSSTADDIDGKAYTWQLVNFDGKQCYRFGTLTIDTDTVAWNEWIEFDSADIKNIINNTTTIANANGGFAAGTGAYVDLGYGGAAVGSGAEATSGGAVGYGACAGPGFSGGATATVTRDENGDPIDAIQLGTGTNTNEKTLQVYDYQLMDADGNIPAERLANAKGKIYTCEIASDDFTEGTSAEGVTYYYCTKTVTGITASDVPIVDASLSSDIDAAKLQLEAYQCVDKIETSADAITVYCFGDLPEVTFSINLMVC